MMYAVRSSEGQDLNSVVPSIQSMSYHLIPPVKLAHARLLGGSLSWYDDGRNPTNVGAGAA